MRRAAPIVLSPEERTILARWARGVGGGARRPERARIVLAAADGARDLEIARALGLNRLTVARWRRRFLVSRLRGIRVEVAPPRGRAGVAEEKIRAILRQSVTRPTEDRRVPSSRALARQFGVSHTTVRRIWDANRVRPVRSGTRPIPSDPAHEMVSCEVVGVYLHPPEYAVATLLGAPSRRSDAERSGLPPERRGSHIPGSGAGGVAQLAHLLGDLGEPSTGLRAGVSRSGNLLRFLAGLHREVGAEHVVRLVVTRPDREAAAALERWRVHHPNFRIEHAGTTERWKERAFEEIDAAGRNRWSPPPSRFKGTSVRSLALSLRAYSDGSVPFEWIATRREIEGGAAGSQLRYDLTSSGHPSLTARSMRGPELAGPAAERRAREMARAVLRQCLRVRPGDRVTIEGWSSTLEYAVAMDLEAARLGARRLLLYEDEPTFWAAATGVRPEYLARVGGHLTAALERTDVLVRFFGPSDRARYHALPNRVRSRLNEFADRVDRAAAQSRCRAVRLEIGRVSPASAQMYRVDADVWRNELVEATLVDPRVLARRGRRIATFLQRGRVLHITHPNGTDLRLRLRGRPSEVVDGVVATPKPGEEWRTVTLPAGVVSVAVDEHYAEGTFRANVASAAGISEEVSDFVGGRWTFEGGRMVRFEYDRGGNTFEESYRRAGVGRDRPAYLSIGLNDHLSSAPLLEDQGAGTVTMHLGRNDHLGGSTRVPWWAWLFQRGSNVTVDGTSVVRDGRLRP